MWQRWVSRSKSASVIRSLWRIWPQLLNGRLLVTSTLAHLLSTLGYVAVECHHSVYHTRVVEMINHLTAAELNRSLGETLRSYVHPNLLLFDKPGYLPIDKCRVDLFFHVVAARYEVGSIVLIMNRPFRL